MQSFTTAALVENFRSALEFDNPITEALSTDQFSAHYPHPQSWAIGPFQRDDSLTFSAQQTWSDPTGIGWRHQFIFNPTLIEVDDQLHLIYRASPRKESTGSRIGHAVFDPARGWRETPEPIIYPTQGNEVWGCEDPKIYAAEGRYFLFYNGIWPVRDSEESRIYPSPSYPLAEVGCDIMLAVSDDLQHWEKVGLIVPYEISRGWAKGAVIPRNPKGEAVKIGDHYLMYLSEGCNGIGYVGRSKDLLTWEFSEQTYLDLDELGGELLEVACASTGHNDHGELVLDFFYRDPAGEFAAAQALYLVDDPFNQLSVSRGGSLAWGGLMKYRNEWTFAQGWDASEGSKEMYFYRAGVQS